MKQQEEQQRQGFRVYVAGSTKYLSGMSLKINTGNMVDDVRVKITT